MSEQQPPAVDLVALARAMRVAFVTLVLCFSYFSVCSSRSIHGFEQIFHDMLGGKPLPPITTLVIHLQFELLALSYAVPLLALASLFLRHVTASFYLLSGLLVVTISQFFLVYHGLLAPLILIATQMQGGGQ